MDSERNVPEMEYSFTWFLSCLREQPGLGMPFVRLSIAILYSEN